MRHALACVVSAYLIVAAFVAIGIVIANPECALKACSGFPLFEESDR